MEACLGVRNTNSMQFVTVEKLQKSPKSRNCRNHESRETAQIVCNALTSANACAEVNNTVTINKKNSSQLFECNITITLNY